jgi:hypothetical protein
VVNFLELLRHLPIDFRKLLPLQLLSSFSAYRRYRPWGQRGRHMQEFEPGLMLGREHGCPVDSAGSTIREISRHNDVLKSYH